MTKLLTSHGKTLQCHFLSYHFSFTFWETTLFELFVDEKSSNLQTSKKFMKRAFILFLVVTTTLHSCFMNNKLYDVSLQLYSFENQNKRQSFQVMVQIIASFCMSWPYTNKNVFKFSFVNKSIFFMQWPLKDILFIKQHFSFYILVDISNIIRHSTNAEKS